VVHLLDVGSAEIQDARLGLHGDDARAQDVAAVAQQAPGDRADAGAAAGDVAADRAGLVGGGVEAELLAAVLRGGGVHVGELGAGLDADAAVVDGLDGGHLREVEDDAAAERHGLAVVAGAAAARGDRDAAGVGGPERADDLRLVRGVTTASAVTASNRFLRTGLYQ
jgi:hypothetical protein